MIYTYASSILWSLRRIISSIDKQNKQLCKSCNLTVPQLICLRQLLVDGPLPISTLARRVCLSKATLTGIIDRLEGKNLVHRERSTTDRRAIYLTLTPEGADMARNLPWPLQERFAVSLAAMSEDDVKRIDASLKQILDMMEAPDHDVWPYGDEDTVPSDATILTPETKEETQ